MSKIPKTVTVVRPGWKDANYDVAAEEDGLLSIQDEDGRVFMTGLPYREDREEAEADPDIASFACPCEGESKPRRATPNIDEDAANRIAWIVEDANEDPDEGWLDVNKPTLLAAAQILEIADVDSRTSKGDLQEAIAAAKVCASEATGGVESAEDLDDTPGDDEGIEGSLDTE